MTSDDAHSVALELERLRGTMEANFAELRGSLTLLVERSARTEQDIRDLRDDTEREITALNTGIDAVRGEVDDLQQTRSRAQGMLWGVAAIVGGGAGYLAQALGR